MRRRGVAMAIGGVVSVALHELGRRWGATRDESTSGGGQSAHDTRDHRPSTCRRDGGTLISRGGEPKCATVPN
jgi:hypothetical protein